MELPPDETGAVPVQYAHAEPRYYGITPTTLVLVLGGAALTLAVVLFALGHWPFGLIALGVSVLLVLIFLEAARRKPDGAVARSTAEALDGFRARAGVAAGSLATRGRAARRLLALRRELQRMSLLRDRLLFELGAAVYRGDEQATEMVRGQVRELDELCGAQGGRDGGSRGTDPGADRPAQAGGSGDRDGRAARSAGPARGGQPRRPSNHPRALSAARRGESAGAGDHAGAGAAGP